MTESPGDIDDDLLSALPEAGFDRIAGLVTRVLDVPIAVVALASEDRVFLKGSIGLSELSASTRELPLASALCESVITTGKPLVVRDRREHPELRHRLPNLDVAGYASIPLVTRAGDVLGTLSALDPRPHPWRSDEIALLSDLAAAATTEAELQLIVARRQRADTALAACKEQLRHAQKLESLALLAGGIAHDFNNVLTVMLSSVSLIRESLADVRAVEVELREIEASAQWGAALTTHLLAFARKQAPRAELTDLNEVTTRAEHLLRRLVGDHIALTTALDPAVEPIWGDPAQIEQVLVNLAINARDAMPRGGRLGIETAAMQLDGTPHAAVTITDAGHGMAPDVIEHLFEPLFTTKPPGEGTGLGLALSQAIMREHGGRIAVWSELGRGSIFRLYFPLAEGPPQGGRGAGASRA